ncbi:outer membrane protein [Polycladidibacter stylochi]|uniref:outer membrane protein n=1 Tax=Polycladidibacter stylochi TaxID=1807766 RepID=UPI00082EC361|nr:outer membrane protein [Pseudovibrio stylochi]
MRFNLGYLFGFLGFLVSQHALAVDLPEPMIAHDPILPQVNTSGWYLRGDIGFAKQTGPRISSLTRHVDADSQLTASGNFGVGYRLGESFRVDLGVQALFPREVSALQPCALACARTSKDHLQVSAVASLVNIYADLGNYGGFTPYVGAGLGAAYVRTADVLAHNSDNSEVRARGAGKWNFAYALMAGTSYEIDQAWSVDAGYQYLALGSGETEAYTLDGQQTRMQLKNLNTHNVRLGLRYQFGGSEVHQPGVFPNSYMPVR